MWGTFGAWLFSDVAGLGRPGGARGWKDLVLKPAAFTHPDVTFASASVDTPIGLASVQWVQEPPVPGWFGTAAQPSMGPSPAVNLVCRSTKGPSTFKGVRFASFGTPSWTSPTDLASYNRSASCDHPNSTHTVLALCEGQRACTIPLDARAFGDTKVGSGSSWCPRPTGPLALAVIMSEDSCDATVVLSVKGTVPVSGRASFVLPIGTATSRAAGDIAVTEGSTNSTFVFEGGNFVAGAALGVTAAAMDSDGAHTRVQTGSGSYEFSVVVARSRSGRVIEE